LRAAGRASVRVATPRSTRRPIARSPVPLDVCFHCPSITSTPDNEAALHPSSGNAGTINPPATPTLELGELKRRGRSLFPDPGSDYVYVGYGVRNVLVEHGHERLLQVNVPL
jgi:hypothetical protein